MWIGLHDFMYTRMIKNEPKSNTTPKASPRPFHHFSQSIHVIRSMRKIIDEFYEGRNNHKRITLFIVCDKGKTSPWSNQASIIRKSIFLGLLGLYMNSENCLRIMGWSNGGLEILFCVFSSIGSRVLEEICMDWIFNEECRP